MDMIKTAQEIGLIETAVNLSQVCESGDVIDEVGVSMPMPDKNIASKIPETVEWIRSHGKSKYLFLTPEIALIEELGSLAAAQEEVIIAVPGDLDPDVRERIENNVPHNIRVTIQSEYDIPRNFYPRNGLMVICGYAAGGRLMVLPETYRLIGRYSDFLGKKLFIPYQELDIAACYDGWMEVSQKNMCVKWRAEHE